MEVFHTLVIYQNSKDPPYTNSDFFNLTNDIIIWCIINFGIERNHWWWQSNPSSCDSKSYFYFRRHDDYVWCKLRWQL